MIVIISGTNRRGSRSLKVSEYLRDAYEREGYESELLDLQQLPAELFLPDAYDETPEAFQRNFVDPVLKADGLHVVTPEYNGSFPGALKYFIDMLPFPQSFEGRPVAFTGISSGRFGALRPVEQLQMVFGYRNAYTYPQRVFIAAAHNLWNNDQAMDDDIHDRLAKQARGFADFCRRIRS